MIALFDCFIYIVVDFVVMFSNLLSYDVLWVFSSTQNDQLVGCYIVFHAPDFEVWMCWFKAFRECLFVIFFMQWEITVYYHSNIWHQKEINK